MRIVFGEPQIPSLISIQQAINDMYVKRITNREGSNHMTITTEQNTTQPVTLDTPSGTVIRLIDGSQTLADAGALAVVDRTLGTDPDRYLPVAWLLGHENRGMTQADGEYDPETFVVNEFQVGDRVRVIDSPFEFGYEGVIASVPAANGDDCVVDIDFPHRASMSYTFDCLEKVSAPDPLIEMRDALMRAFGQAVAADEPAYEEGDVLVLVPGSHRTDSHPDWNGIRVRVVKDSGYDGIDTIYVVPLDERPDGFGLSGFNWEREDFRRFDATDFRVGDVVKADRFGVDGEPAKAVVTRLEGDFGGDIEVNWTEGLSSLVAYGPIGARRIHLTLIGVETGFEFEVGQEVAPEGVADLPDDTVLRVENGVAVIAFVGESA